ncbi:MAG TPA: SRPBCC family protein [Tepidiformaceae bacterium]|nr:SRPBCC family protein [Tepidiformaceae bacterium]
MPRWEHTIEIHASPEAIWDVLTDLERWPHWTPSVRSLKPLTDGKFDAGTQARVHPAGSAESTWTVTLIDPGRSFRWATRVRGAATIGDHIIAPVENGARVTLAIEVHGLAGKVFKPLIGPGIARNLKAEAEGLKRESEARA